MKNLIRIDAGEIFTPTAVLKESCVVINDQGRVEFVGPRTKAPVNASQTIQAEHLRLAPGFLDIHVHGGNGIGFGIGDNWEADLEKYSQWVLKSGVTDFLCTLAAPSHKDLCTMMETYVSYLEKGTKGASAVGIHLEGPYLNPERKGAFNPAWLRTPNVAEAQELLRIGGKWLKQMTLAPELPNAVEVAAEFRKAGVTVALGHSAADYDTAKAALMGDFTHVTHTYNAQTGLNHRAPGVVGAVLSSDEITGELIADGIHVYPGAMRVLLRALSTKRVVLITDAIPGAGLPDGVYSSIGQTIIVKDGRATLENGTLAGSAAILNRCVGNIHKLAGASVQDAIRMATLNPAQVIHMQDELGVIATGRKADMILLDADFNVHMSMVKGQVLFSDL
jgi:N-acetylglucosamine-6-phosphate deacetylase